VDPDPIRSRFDLANRCYAIASVANGKFVAASGSAAYRADVPSQARAAAFFLKPSGLGRYLPYDQRGQLLSVRPMRGAGVGRLSSPGRLTEWALAAGSAHSFSFTSTANGRQLEVAPATGELIVTAPGTAGRRRLFVFVPMRGCRPFPEAQVGAVGRSFTKTNRDGTVAGFADAHLHITADLRAGGRVIHGQTFDRFGIQSALGDDARDHGADGGLDVTGNLLRTGLPFGTHDTQGWPTFAGWPVHDTVTHQQTYYAWLQRAWMAGLRLVVAQTVEDEPFCRIEPLKAHSCSETLSVELQIRRLRGLQDYVDAQSGGPGRGWFRLVYDPGQARRVIERGKLAVVIGIESSNPLGCSERLGRPQCARADVAQRLDRYHRLGVRGLFVAHWVDNAFSGAAIEAGAKGAFINVFNRLQTGRYFHTGRCPEAGQGEELRTLSRLQLQVLARFFPTAQAVADEGMPTYPLGRRCNARGLTSLGRYLIRRLMAEHMLIEVDHLSETARHEVLAMAEAARYPLVSSHNGTGGRWTPAELKRLYALGGFAAATPETAPELAAKILSLRRYRSAKHYFGVALGTDTGGFSKLPGPRANAGRSPLHYPFRSYLCRISFARERTGARVYDLNRDGVAHYGLFADLLADMQRRRRGAQAMRPLFRSAEAYLQMWQRADGGA
jgi:microsomal dipeptidase-like Zn-dependent dipeptidase